LSLFTLLVIACGSTESIGDQEANQTEASEDEGTDPDFGAGAKPPEFGPNGGAGPSANGGAPAEAPTGNTEHWLPCQADTECQSGWCGCAHGETKLCLPSKTFPKTCSTLDTNQLKTGAANWSACTAGDTCRSKVCGCYGSTEKQCLPDQTFSKTCAATGSSLGGTCTGDGDCASKVCGCFGSTRKQCLPDSSYKTACEAPSTTACRAPFTMCNGRCTDMSIDTNNCGSCGNACRFYAPTCRNGGCTF
jgi:hypothetical protein